MVMGERSKKSPRNARRVPRESHAVIRKSPPSKPCSGPGIQTSRGCVEP
jgi:hypothetical protein